MEAKRDSSLQAMYTFCSHHATRIAVHKKEMAPRRGDEAPEGRGSPEGGEAPFAVRRGTERFLHLTEVPAACLFRREHTDVVDVNFLGVAVLPAGLCALLRQLLLHLRGQLG
jgi:hypothetical protein